jgi:hypothetical protein
MNTKSVVAAIGVALVASSFTLAADKQMIKSRDGSCQVSVPANWVPGELGGTADAPDHRVSMAVSSPKMIDSYAEAKQSAQTVYKNSKVTVNSLTEFVMEGQSITGKPDVYRIIPISSSKFCIVEVMYQNGTVEQAREIASSLHAAK